MDDKETEIVDNKKLAEDVSNKIGYQMCKAFLVKPLDPVKVTKEFSKPVEKGEATKDENGIEAKDYDTVETEVKEVDSDYRKGVVLKVPFEYTQRLDDDKYAPMPIEVGDIIVFKDKFGQYFDLCKDTMLISIYDIVALEK